MFFFLCMFLEGLLLKNLGDLQPPDEKFILTDTMDFPAVPITPKKKKKKKKR